jgi:hypothetical protein
LNIEAVEGGTKILATGSASVSFDDVDSTKDARIDAEMESKAFIAKFMQEGIQRDTTITKVVQESKSTTAEGRRAGWHEVIKRVQTMRSSSQALLRGVVPLSSCCTQRRELQVSVGITPETIRAAGSMAGAISSSLGANPTPGTAGSQSGAAACPPRPEGMHAQHLKDRQIVRVVAREELLEVGDLEREFAISSAELKAKTMLIGKGTNAALLCGDIRDFVCTDQGFVYVGIRIDSEHLKQASALQQMIAEPLRASATPGAKETPPGR